MRQHEVDDPIEAQAIALLDALWSEGFIEGRPYPAAMVDTIAAALKRLEAPDVAQQPQAECSAGSAAIKAPMDAAEIMRMFAAIPFR